VAAEDFFKQMGLDHLSDDEKQKMAEDVGQVVLDRVEHRCLSLLGRKERKAFEKAMQADPAEAYALLDQYLPDTKRPSFQSIMDEETERIRTEMLGTQNAVMQKLGLS
jgi:hypothetical protein